MGAVMSGETRATRSTTSPRVVPASSARVAAAWWVVRIGDGFDPKVSDDDDDEKEKLMAGAAVGRRDGLDRVRFDDRRVLGGGVGEGKADPWFVHRPGWWDRRQGDRSKARRAR